MINTLQATFLLLNLEELYGAGPPADGEFIATLVEECHLDIRSATKLWMAVIESQEYTDEFNLRNAC